MSLSILRYPALLDSVNRIGRQLHSQPRASSMHEEMRTRYLVLEGQLDAVLQRCGIGVFAASVEDTIAIMNDDPGVAAGVFIYQVHPCLGFPGDALP